MSGSQLEAAGWRQGTIVEDKDAKEILEGVDDQYEEGIVLVVASHSCDLANNKTEDEPYVEMSIARRIERLDNALINNRNPRKLHTKLRVNTGAVDIQSELCIELKAFNKCLVPKDSLAKYQPDKNRTFSSKLLEEYVAWLAARYKRPAFPSAFNERIAKADPRGMLRKIAKSANRLLSGIYVNISPDKEIGAEESYGVDLLGVVPVESDAGGLKTAKSDLGKIARIMAQAGMEVRDEVLKEDQVSIAVIRRFKRLYFDDLSYKNDTPLPVEAKSDL